MLKQLPGQSSIVDGDCVETQTYDAGVYKYQTADDALWPGGERPRLPQSN